MMLFIKAEVEGWIYKWHKVAGKVYAGDPICDINMNIESPSQSDPDLHQVTAPVGGYVSARPQYFERTFLNSIKVYKNDVIADLYT